MNWIDLVIIILLLFFALEGIRRSFIGEMLDFLSFLLAFFLSLRFYNSIGMLYETSFGLPHSISNVFGFISIWFLVETGLYFSTQLLLSKFKIIYKLNQKLTIFSVIPALLRGIVFVAVMLVLLGTFPIQPQIKKAVLESKIGSVVLKNTQLLEKPLKNVFGGLTNDTFTFFTIKPKSNETVDLGFKTSEFKPRPDLESQMIELVNEERQKQGVKKLTYRSELLEVGRSHSADMFKRGYFSHYSPEGKSVADRADEKNISYLVIGENLAYAPNLELAHKGLMDSPGHRANILSPDYNHIAIGIMDGGVYGLMITQVFTN